MFTVSIETQFRASHQLILRGGSKEPLHQHDWVVTVKVSSEMLDSMGLVMDFGKLKTIVREVTAGLDNIRLDNIDYFRRNNPSAENVAKYIFDEIESKMPSGVKLRSVKVVEEPGCSAKFSK